MSEIEKKINDFINEQEDWKQKNLKMFRRLMNRVAEDVVEDWKWSVPVFVVNGKQFSAMSTFKEHTKFNFFKGAKMKDPEKLFNSGLDSKQHRSINLSEGESIDEKKLESLIKQGLEDLR